MVLNPYWEIPPSIAESEIWVSVKRNNKYLQDKHIQVLKLDKSHQYKIVDASKINWMTLTPREFDSYRYRQLPGSDNALGKVKFIFSNSCGIYLHDSNESVVFTAYARAFSHGCVRIAEPLNLSTYALHTEKDWSGAKIAAAFAHDIDRTVMLPKPLPLYFIYLTSWVNDDGWVQFRPDIYHLDHVTQTMADPEDDDYGDD